MFRPESYRVVKDSYNDDDNDDYICIRTSKANTAKFSGVTGVEIIYKNEIRIEKDNCCMCQSPLDEEDRLWAIEYNDEGESGYCGHWLHLNCARQYYHRSETYSCPVCKRKITDFGPEWQRIIMGLTWSHSKIFQYARDGGRSNISRLKKLLKEGVFLNKTDISGCTPLNLACMYLNCEGIKLLLENGADPNIGNDVGRYPLHYAVSNDLLDHERAVKLLLQNGRINVNVQDANGETALHLAVRNRSEFSIQSLLSHPNIMESITNNRGETAHDLKVRMDSNSDAVQTNVCTIC